MTAIDIAPDTETTEATTVDRSKVNVAADSEANRTENFASKPMTGDEYIESLRDDREIWLNGERVKDVTTHEAFRNPIRMTARLYDAMHDPATKDKVTAPTDTGNGGVTMPFFRAPKSADDLRADRDAIATWARMTYGWMGRSPDYKASFLGT
ncbi:4-hydroxyphenylacetate 3-hydroxylase N-terminal domain-containing protein, partial [Gordonia sp. GN26]